MRADELLHHHNLKRTGCREGIIELILKEGRALSENEIRDRLEGRYDRTTFYRSFRTLQEHRIIHRIVVDNHLVKYAIDQVAESQSNHPHFYCKSCSSVSCIGAVTVEKPVLPEGFTPLETELIIRGICNECKDSV